MRQEAVGACLLVPRHRLFTDAAFEIPAREELYMLDASIYYPVVVAAVMYEASKVPSMSVRRIVWRSTQLAIRKLSTPQQG
jgi:hypothetical protein